MIKITALGLASVMLCGCVVEPHTYAPAYPYGYAYNQQFAPYAPYRPRRSVPPEEQAEPDAYAAPVEREPSDAEEVMRSPDEEEVIGGDDPPPDHSIRRSRPQPSIERHRDHSGDYRP